MISWVVELLINNFGSGVSHLPLDSTLQMIHGFSIEYRPGEHSNIIDSKLFDDSFGSVGRCFIQP